jgi:L-fuconate dehydratase
MERNVLEYAEHLHEHFIYPVSINDKGRYNVPIDPHGGYRYVSLAFPRPCATAMKTRADVEFFTRYSIEMRNTSIAEYEWPNGSYWVNAKGKVS